MTMTERSTPVELSRLFTGKNATLLQGKTPEQVSFLERVASLRLKVKSGEIPLKDATLGTDKSEISRVLGKELRVLHNAIPIMDMKLRVPKSAIGVDSELRLGEVTNYEGL